MLKVDRVWRLQPFFFLLNKLLYFNCFMIPLRVSQIYVSVNQYLYLRLWLSIIYLPKPCHSELSNLKLKLVNKRCNHYIYDTLHFRSNWFSLTTFFVTCVASYGLDSGHESKLLILYLQKIGFLRWISFRKLNADLLPYFAYKNDVIHV